MNGQEAAADRTAHSLLYTTEKTKTSDSVVASRSIIQHYLDLTGSSSGSVGYRGLSERLKDENAAEVSASTGYCSLSETTVNTQTDNTV